MQLKLYVLLFASLASGCDLLVDSVETAHTLQQGKEVQDEVIARFSNPNKLMALLAEIEASYPSTGPRDFSGISSRSSEFLGGDTGLITLRSTRYNSNPHGSYAITFKQLDSKQCHSLIAPAIAGAFRQIVLNSELLRKDSHCNENQNEIMFVSN